MIQTKLKGMGVALITPFKEDESVDYDALMRMVDYLLQNNADFLCVLGTTAETPTLTEEEKKTIKKMVIDRVNGRIPILLGVGGNNTRAIVETLKNDDFTGVDAILSVVPYYNKPSQEGIYQHYKAIAEATELPIVLYNVPGRTGVIGQQFRQLADKKLIISGRISITFRVSVPRREIDSELHSILIALSLIHI